MTVTHSRLNAVGEWEVMPPATPGPWFQSHRRNADGMYRTQVYDAAGEEIATLAWYPVHQPGGVIATAREANARLIVAAPDFHQGALAFIEYEKAMAKGRDFAAMAHFDTASKMLHAAISKAKGE